MGNKNHGKLIKVAFSEVERFYWQFQHERGLTEAFDFYVREERFCKEFGCRFVRKQTELWVVFDNAEDMTAFLLRAAAYAG